MACGGRDGRRGGASLISKARKRDSGAQELKPLVAGRGGGGGTYRGESHGHQLGCLILNLLGLDLANAFNLGKLAARAKSNLRRCFCLFYVCGIYVLCSLLGGGVPI